MLLFLKVISASSMIRDNLCTNALGYVFSIANFDALYLRSSTLQRLTIRQRDAFVTFVLVVRFQPHRSACWRNIVAQDAISGRLPQLLKAFSFDLSHTFASHRELFQSFNVFTLPSSKPYQKRNTSRSLGFKVFKTFSKSSFNNTLPEDSSGCSVILSTNVSSTARLASPAPMLRQRNRSHGSLLDLRNFRFAFPSFRNFLQRCFSTVLDDKLLFEFVHSRNDFKQVQANESFSIDLRWISSQLGESTNARTSKTCNHAQNRTSQHLELNQRILLELNLGKTFAIAIGHNGNNQPKVRLNHMVLCVLLR